MPSALVKSKAKVKMRKMATPEEEENLTEENIDSIGMKEALRICKKHHIDLSGDPPLPEIKYILKLRFLCKGKTRTQVIKSLSDASHVDETRRQELVAIYDTAIDNAENIGKMDDPILEELKKMFPGFDKDLNYHKLKAAETTAPVLVLGETGTGKSSFINVLLGEDYLPTSLLPNTHVISEIRSSRDQSAYAIVFPTDEKENKPKKIELLGDDKETFKQELATYIQDTDAKTGKQIYNSAQIYLPCDILDTGLVIVDSPGIGETPEMKELVLDYILRACTFIYVINSSCAGGVQNRLQELVKEVYNKAINEQREYRPESALFICNKWDLVDSLERQEVWEDTKSKISSCWPNCKESQIFTFSTKEAAYIQRGGGMVPKLGNIMAEITKLIPLGREIVIYREFKFLENFARKCMLCFDSHLQQINLSQTDRERRQRQAQDRLRALKRDNDTFFEDQQKMLKNDISNIAQNLKRFIKQPENLKRICSFSHRPLPSGEVWKKVSIGVRAHVYNELMKLIKEWEEDMGEFKKIGDNIAQALEGHFPKFEAQIYNAEEFMSGPKRDAEEHVSHEEEELQLVPNYIKDKFVGLNFGMRLAVGIGLAPVFFVGMAVRLPVLGIKTLKRSIDNFWLESKFNDSKAEKDSKEAEKDLKELAEKYAKSTVDSITEKIKLESIIEEDIQPLFTYIRQQKQRLEDLIEGDMNLLKNLQAEARSDADVQRTYEPLKAIFEILQRTLKHFMIMRLSSKRTLSWAKSLPVETVEVTDKKICSGYGADIYQATSKDPEKTNGWFQVAVRCPRERVRPQNVHKYQDIEMAYCHIKESNIVTYIAATVHGSSLYQVLEPLQCSLRSYLPEWQEDFANNKLNKVVEVMKYVVSGLRYLHDKHFVHFDLSMDTIAVDSHGEIKLTNISTERSVNIEPTGTIRMIECLHINPMFFYNKNRVTYKANDDMFGVGVMMSELWTQQPVCDLDLEEALPDDKSQVDGQKFKESLEKLQPKQSPHFDVEIDKLDKEFIKDWWAAIQSCLSRELSSKDLEAKLDQVYTFPGLTQVDALYVRDEHF